MNEEPKTASQKLSDFLANEKITINFKGYQQTFDSKGLSVGVAPILEVIDTPEESPATDSPSTEAPTQE